MASDKGHKAEIAAFVQAVQQGGPAPIPFEELVEVTRVSFEVIESAKPSIFSIQHAQYRLRTSVVSATVLWPRWVYFRSWYAVKQRSGWRKSSCRCLPGKRNGSDSF